MPEPTPAPNKDIPRSWNPKYRRRKSHDGIDWAPASYGDSATGLWCRACKARHGYNGKGKMIIRYEKFGATFRMIWFCPKYGNQLGETVLGDSEEASDSHGGS